MLKYYSDIIEITVIMIQADLIYYISRTRTFLD